MTKEEVAILAHKVKTGTATQVEELVLLKFLNQGVDEMRVFIKEVMTDK